MEMPLVVFVRIVGGYECHYGRVCQRRQGGCRTDTAILLLVETQGICIQIEPISYPPSSITILVVVSRGLLPIDRTRLRTIPLSIKKSPTVDHVRRRDGLVRPLPRYIEIAQYLRSNVDRVAGDAARTGLGGRVCVGYGNIAFVRYQTACVIILPK